MLDPENKDILFEFDAEWYLDIVELVEAVGEDSEHDVGGLHDGDRLAGLHHHHVWRGRDLCMLASQRFT